jgi:hypothetical protein
MIDPAITQIWAPMSSPQQIVSSKVICTYFPRIACVTYDRKLLHRNKEDEAMCHPSM